MADEKYIEIKELPKLYKVSVNPTKKDELQQEIPPFIDYRDIKSNYLKNKYKICLKNDRGDE